MVRVAGIVVGGLALCTVVMLAVLAWLGSGLKRLQPHRPIPVPVHAKAIATPEEARLAS